MTWRIVNTDNFGSDYPDEKFAEGEYATQAEAQLKADSMNGDDSVYAPRYFKVVELPYKLLPGFEP